MFFSVLISKGLEAVILVVIERIYSRLESLAYDTVYKSTYNSQSQGMLRYRRVRCRPGNLFSTTVLETPSCVRPAKRTLVRK